MSSQTKTPAHNPMTHSRDGWPLTPGYAARKQAAAAAAKKNAPAVPAARA